MHDTNIKREISKKELASYLRISLASLYRYLKSDYIDIPRDIIPRGTLKVSLFNTKEVLDYIEKKFN